MLNDDDHQHLCWHVLDGLTGGAGKAGEPRQATLPVLTWFLRPDALPNAVVNSSRHIHRLHILFVFLFPFNCFTHWIAAILGLCLEGFH